MEHRAPIYDLIGRWPGRAELAEDLSKIIGQHVSVDRVHKWAQLGSIPSGMQKHVVDAAARRGISISASEMLDLHAVRTRPAPTTGGAA